jgi:hypothetical protein
MQLDKVLHNFVGKSLTSAGIRATKVNALIDMTDSLLNESDLTLTSLGRNLAGQADVKHKIKRVDRWLNNTALYQQSKAIYKAIFHKVLSQRKRLEILVDWSGCCNWTETCLRASLAYSGRSITIYQEVHSSETQQKESVHNQFLKNLKEIIPAICEVTIITDRGFGPPWFKAVKALDWDFVGRAPSFHCYQISNEITWNPIKSLYEGSTNKATYVGNALLGKTHREKLEVSLYSYKVEAKNRKKHKTRNKQNYLELNKQYSEMHKTPWVLATSLKGGKNISKKIIKNYALRMQIEQNFRDDKNERWGFGIRYSRTTSTQRMTILLLLAAIASYILLLFGVASESKELHRKFQANTVRNRRVLSLLTLGKQVIKHVIDLFNTEDLFLGLKKMAIGDSYKWAT